MDNSLPQKLSKEEKEIYRAIGCKIAVNKTVINEGLAIPAAVMKIDSFPKPDIPILMFVSDGKETGVENWVDIPKDYAANLSNAKVIEFDCGHYVHNFEQEQINKDLREFAKKLNK